MRPVGERRERQTTKPDSSKLVIRRDHPGRQIIWHGGWSLGGSYKLWEGSKIAIPIALASGLYSSCNTIQAVM